jgi:hypothetical protein
VGGKERVVKHLEITQGVINRLANNSFLIKGWSMTILAAAILFIARVESDNSVYLTLSFVIPVISFWVLDGYFLWQERLFRGIYNDIRTQDDSDFKMDIPAQLKKPNNKWRNAVFSITLNIFYFAELSFLGFVAFILSCS